MKYLTTKEVAERWGGIIQPGTIENWRQQKKGPKFVKLGKGKTSPVVYRLKDLVAFEKSGEWGKYL